MVLAGRGRRRSLLVSLVVVVMMLAACSGGGADSTEATTEPEATTETTEGSSETTAADTAEPTEPTEPVEAGEEQVLTFAYNQEPTNWDFYTNPQTAVSVATYQNVYESLLKTGESGEVEPWLAESYEMSDDGLEYTFVLREATFHDGSEFDAADVVYSLETNSQAENNKYGAGLENLESVEAVDDRTVRVTLSQPSPTLLTGMGGLPGVIVPEGFREDYSPATEAIGTGPYVFSEHNPGVDVTLTRFEDYWGEQPFFDRAVQRFIPDETAAINALLAGDIDAISALAGDGLDQIESLDDRDDVYVVLTIPVQVNWLYMNPTAEKYQDQRVRAAIAHAVDRQALMDAGVRGLGEVNCLPVVPFTAPYNTGACPYEYDPDRARELLAEAGAEGIEIEFRHPGRAEFPPIAEVLAQQLNSVGFSVTTRASEGPTYMEQVWGGGDYDLGIMTGFAGDIGRQQCGGVPQPANLFDESTCPTDIMSKVEQALVAPTHEEYVSTMSEAVEAYAELAWAVPTFSKNTPRLGRAGLEGIVTNPIEGSFPVAPLRWEN